MVLKLFGGVTLSDFWGGLAMPNIGSPPDHWASQEGTGPCYCRDLKPDSVG